MPENATIFIPDISGYTDFISKTELEHGAFIINHLLDTIVNSVGEEYVVSEIEGDAVLLYKKGAPPTKKEIVDQCVKTFTNFHREIRSLCTTSLCQCGACKSATDLTLKFIVHYGTIAEINVSRFVKASGVDMVIAHRLLKNSIPEHEYVLTTHNYLNNIADSNDADDLDWNQSKEEYPSIGVVEFNFASLSSVKQAIPPSAGMHTSSVPANPDQSFTSEFDISAPYIYVHECLLDFSKRKQFLLGYQQGEGPEMLYLGAKHLCVFDDGNITIEPVHIASAPGEINYEELASSPESGYYALYSFNIKSLDKERCRVRATISPQPAHSFPPAMLATTQQRLDATALRMKDFCEKSFAAQKVVPVA